MRVGLFLAIRYIKNANIWTTFLIVFIMLLTFLNVIVVRGILVGLPEGAQLQYQKEFAGDVIVTPLADRNRIEQTPTVERIIQNIDGYGLHSLRYVEGGSLSANYKLNRSPREVSDSVGVQIVGIDPDAEDRATQLSSMVIDGRYLEKDDANGIMVGSQLLNRFSLIGGSENATVADVYPGTTVRLAINGFQREYVVRGIVKSKGGENSRRVFMTANEAKKVMGRFDNSGNEIAIFLTDGTDAEIYKQKVSSSEVAMYALVQTAEESQGQFLKDIRNTFEVLSTVIGVIGITVAAITVFIVIFIFAITRQKQIGILKGIGINRFAIESSFVFLSIFYAVIGIALGSIALYYFIEPYIVKNPIDFPFADGLLVVPFVDTAYRSIIIMLATLIAGYVPARTIIKKNTINSILGR